MTPQNNATSEAAIRGAGKVMIYYAKEGVIEILNQYSIAEIIQHAIDEHENQRIKELEQKNKEFMGRFEDNALAWLESDNVCDKAGCPTKIENTHLTIWERIGWLAKERDQAQQVVAGMREAIKEYIDKYVWGNHGISKSGHLGICSFQHGDPLECHVCGNTLKLRNVITSDVGKNWVRVEDVASTLKLCQNMLRSLFEDCLTPSQRKSLYEALHAVDGLLSALLKQKDSQ